MTSSEVGDGAIFRFAGYSFAFIRKKKPIFVFDIHGCINEGRHVSNEKDFLLKFCSIAAVNEFFVNFFKDKSKSTLQYDIWYIKTERSEVDIQVESISVNPKKSSATGKSINFCSNNIRKFVFIKKAVLGSYHQGNIKYGETAGIQCTRNAFIAVCFSAVKNVSIWKSWDLDFVLDQGDILMKSLSLYHGLVVDELHYL